MDMCTAFEASHYPVTNTSASRPCFTTLPLTCCPQMYFSLTTPLNTATPSYKLADRSNLPVSREQQHFCTTCSLDFAILPGTCRRCIAPSSQSPACRLTKRHPAFVHSNFLPAVSLQFVASKHACVITPLLNTIIPSTVCRP